MVVRMPVAAPGVERGDGHYQTTVLDAFQSNKDVGEAFYVRSLAMNNQHFKAGVVIEVGMRGGNNQVVVFVLRLGEFLGDTVGVMVIDERDRADHGRAG